MKKVLLLLTLLSISQSKGLSQKIVDSLSIKQKADFYFDYSETFWPQFPDSTIYYTILAANSYQEIGNEENYLICLSGIANAFYLNDDFIKSLEYYSKLDSLYGKVKFNNVANEKIVLTHLGSYHRILQNYKRSVELLKKSLLLEPDKFDNTTFINIGYSYFLLGDYNKSEVYFLQALNYNTNYDQLKFSNSGAYKVLGNLYFKKKKYEKSIDTYQKILKNIHLTSSNNMETEYVSNISINLALAYIKTKKYQNCLRIISSIQFSELNTLNKVRYLECLAQYYYQTGFYQLAITKINEGLEIIKNNNFNYDLVELNFSLLELQCNVNLKQNNSAGALDSNDQILNLLGIDASNYDDVLNIKNKVLCAKAIGVRNKILRFFLDKEKLIENISIFQKITSALRQQNSTASHKEFWANENLEIYQDVISTLIQSNDTNKAFTFAEENKSNLLIQSLNDIDAKSYANIPEKILDTERELRAKLQFYQKRKFELENNDSEIDTSKLIAYSDVITKTDFAIQAIVDTLESQYPEYYEIKYSDDDLTVESIQELLDYESCFIEYFVGKDSSYVFTITKDDVRVQKLGNLNDNNHVFLSYYNSLKDPSISKDSLEFYSSQVYKLILKESLNRLDSNIENLIIVPDDILNNLPFEFLKDKNEEQILGLKYNIQYQYSGRLWRLLKNRKSIKKQYDFLGYAYNSENTNFLNVRTCTSMEADNLLCSQREVDNIAEILKDKNLLLGLNNKEDILSNASNTKILHLATHSCLETENSDYSRIFFDDDYMTNIDLQLQQIDAELAVLSACESGYGELIKGEGAMSISKGFFHAGCKSTVVSLWPVDDCSTSDIMKHFYTFLKEGDKKDVALKKAKQLYLETAHPSRTHPYYWAGFILIGNNNPVWNNQSFNWLYPFVGVLVLLLVFISLKSIRSN